MATKGTTAGLLSKMAKFVRHPTKDWSELDKLSVEPAPVPEQDRGYSKQALKEMIERKRQNDFVRRREFDELRKMRRAGPAPNPDAAGRPSFFQGTTTTSNLEERANTIKKIDEIEAQMSKQWWKGKQDDAAVEGDNFHLSASLHLPQGQDLLKADARQGSTDPLQPAAAPDATQGQSSDFDPTQPGLPDPDRDGSDLLALGGVFHKSADGKHEASGIGSPTSKLFSIELGDSLTDTDMEEAAIRFANGDDAGAEAGLLAALKTDNVRPDIVQGWAAALFDLYRATGQQGSFEHVASDYARRFGHTAPPWFSTPDLLLGESDTAVTQAGSVSDQSRPAMWDCPGELDSAALQALLSSVSHTPQPWRLSWRRMKVITPDAGTALADLFAQWCTQPVTLHFDGGEVLDRTLRTKTPSGDKEVAMFWWRLRLDALRIMQLQDEFELAALDFCVTYEVSPPPWQNAQCLYGLERMALRMEPQELDESDEDAPRTDFQATVDATEPMNIDEMSTRVVELCGEVLGDAAQALNKLQTEFQGATRLVISCDKLIRVDFSAAGSILNWVAAREAEGCHVQFRDVPRLIAAFFNVIGISEHARVVLRGH